MIGQVAAGPARSQLEEIHEIVKSGMPDSPWAGKSLEQILEECQAQLDQALLENQQDKAILIQQLELQDQPLLTPDAPLGTSTEAQPPVP